MLGSSNSISCANIHLNAAVAETLRQFADILENADDFNATLHSLIKDTIKEHKRIIFNGNGYDDKWIEEAEKRGLSNLRTTADCMPKICDKKNVDMLVSHGIFTEAEIFSRRDIMLENYVKQVNIEANTMVYMSRRQILPAVSKFTADKKNICDVACSYETNIISTLSELTDSIDSATAELETAILNLKGISEIMEQANFVRDVLLPAMDKLRKFADKAETLTSEEYYPFPTYDKLLFGV